MLPGKYYIAFCPNSVLSNLAFQPWESFKKYTDDLCKSLGPFNSCVRAAQVISVCKESNLIAFLAVKLAAVESSCPEMRQPSDRVIQRGAKGCACSPSLWLFYFCHSLPFFLLYFNSGQNKFSFPEGIPWGKQRDATDVVWSTQALLKTLVARLIQGIPHWTVVTKKNRPSHVVWVQPCTLSPVLEALLAQKELVARGKEMRPHKKRENCF